MKNDLKMTMSFITTGVVILSLMTFNFKEENMFPTHGSIVNPTQDELAEVLQNKKLEAFVKIYNSGNKKALKRFIKQNFSKNYTGFLNSRVPIISNYWLNVHREFGFLELLPIEKDTIDTRTVSWAKGQKSQVYVGLIHRITDDDKPIRRLGVLRGAVPGHLKKREKAAELNIDQIKKHLNKLSKADLFSGSVLIAQADKIILNESYGFANKASKLANKPDTKYLISSTSKMFTATAIAQLVEQGKLSYDDPISKFLPDYPKWIGEKVTIHHLLTHSSGIELDELKKYNKAEKKASSLNDLYKIHLENLPQLKNYDNYQVPNTFNYTNQGFNLAGLIIEKVSGQDFYTYIQENIFDRLEMNQSGDFVLSRDKDKIAMGYHSKNATSHRKNIHTKLPHRSKPSGAFYSTTSDLFFFMKGLKDGKLIKKENFQTISSPKIDNIDSKFLTLKYGYGFMIDQTRGIHKIGHNGNFYGLSSRCEWFPESDYFVIVLSNYNNAANTVGNYIRDRICFRD